MSAWDNERGGLAAPGFSAAVVAPHDTNDLLVAARCLYVGTSGSLKVDMAGTGEAVVFASVPVGILPIRVTRVYDTDTDAADIVAIW